MSRPLSDEALQAMKIRAASHAPYAYDLAPADRRELLAEVDRLRKQLDLLRYRPQQLPLFELAQRG